MSDLTEQVIAQLYDYLDDKDTTTDAANKIITLIRELIAKEIEATCEAQCELSGGWHCQAEEMAAIARGEVKE